MSPPRRFALRHQIDPEALAEGIQHVGSLLGAVRSAGATDAAPRAVLLASRAAEGFLQRRLGRAPRVGQECEYSSGGEEPSTSGRAAGEGAAAGRPRQPSPAELRDLRRAVGAAARAEATGGAAGARYRRRARLCAAAALASAPVRDGALGAEAAAEAAPALSLLWETLLWVTAAAAQDGAEPAAAVAVARSFALLDRLLHENPRLGAFCSHI